MKFVREQRVRAVWAACTALAVGVAVWGGWSYAAAAGDEDLEFAKVREEVREQGSSRLEQLNSIDAKNVTAGLQRWLDATTGPLHSELKRSNDASAQAMKAKPSTVRARVTDAAVTELDARAGTAKLIAALTVDLTPAGSDTVKDRKRLEVSLDRTADGWKIKSVSALAVGG